ncbi:MAG TPA: hypothetical protein VJ673_04215 [Aromatoleum sp.]|uniref:hypothetical protein n=1 Tax=Aromatoleum sp. TaxID=2307007 RepID=UPI002B4A2ECD|nr:hypothetical protein [Aromatoleum sp.]HJV24864.1 hypothetical protein [Aromatoleum sp.]
MLTVIDGDGTEPRPQNHHQQLLDTIHEIERLVIAGQLGNGQSLASEFTPIERAFVTERMFRDGFEEEILVKVLVP